MSGVNLTRHCKSMYKFYLESFIKAKDVVYMVALVPWWDVMPWVNITSLTAQHHLNMFDA